MSTRQQVLSELRPRRDEAYKDILASFLSSLPDEDGKGSLARFIGRASKRGNGYLACRRQSAEPNLVAMNFVTPFDFAMVGPLQAFQKNAMDVVLNLL